MITKTLNGKTFKSLVVSGAKCLRDNIEEVNNLNVFPVPDGDTGTNMCHTIEGGVASAKGVDSEKLSDICKPMSSGMLLGARGNSGVILSQIFRGICKGLQDKEEATALDLVRAYELGVKQAYGAVVTPVEGTILTVFREATEYTAEHIDFSSTINDFYHFHLQKAAQSLANTINLLPVLKEAGVIDSGGAGYVRIVEGMIKFLEGEEVDLSFIEDSKSETSVETAATVDFSAFGPDDELKFGYCTEFILRLQNSKVDIENFDIQKVIDILNGDDIKGDSIVALCDDSVVKVHVHTKDPGKVLDHMRKFGEFLTIKIENMALQHNEQIGDTELEAERLKEHKKYAVVAVATGDGIKQQFTEFGVDAIIDGGQSMNPSTEDFIKAFKSLDAENIIVFPNNKNIIMAAKQAATLYKGSHVEVIGSTTIPQCYSALTMLDYSSDDLTIIVGNFKEAIDRVSSGEITTSIRNTTVNKVEIKKGDYIGILDGKLLVSNIEKLEALKSLISKVKDIDEKEVLIILCGKNVSEEEKESLQEMLSDSFPQLECGVMDGGQDVYDYLFSIE